jgi:hypothetical protein
VIGILEIGADSGYQFRNRVHPRGFDRRQMPISNKMQKGRLFGFLINRYKTPIVQD